MRIKFKDVPAGSIITWKKGENDLIKFLILSDGPDGDYQIIYTEGERWAHRDRTEKRKILFASVPRDEATVTNPDKEPVRELQWI